jgi:hypothetical protein
LNDIGRNSLLGKRKIIAKFLKRTFTCRSTFLYGAYLRCPVFTTVHFSLRNEGSSEYICVCEGRESLRPNFYTLKDPRHRFHGIDFLKPFAPLYSHEASVFVVKSEQQQKVWRHRSILPLLESLKFQALENFVC